MFYFNQKLKLQIRENLFFVLNMCPGRDEQNVYITYNVFPKSASYGLKISPVITIKYF